MNSKHQHYQPGVCQGCGIVHDSLSNYCPICTRHIREDLDYNHFLQRMAGAGWQVQKNGDFTHANGTNLKAESAELWVSKKTLPPPF